MAFNLQTFKTRALTAIVFVVVMLIGILWSKWSYLILISIIHGGCWLEYQKLVGLLDPDYTQIKPLHKYGVIILGWGILLWMAGANYALLNINMAVIGWSMFWLGLLAFVLSDFLLSKKITPRLWAHSGLGILYISISCGCMMLFVGVMNGVFGKTYFWVMPACLIASIWINDTMAYLVGSFFGKTPLSPISPKKTWEGTIGGAVLAILFVSLVGFYSFGLPMKALLFISVTASISGTVGDLFESKLKRLAGVKDSGNFMPGHGGFLDRFDSLLVASTCTWLVFYFLY